MSIQKLRTSQGVLCLMVLTLFLGCNNDDDNSKLKPKNDQFPENSSLTLDEINELLDATELELPTSMDQPSGGRIEAVSTIGFDDEDVCLWTPEICRSGVAIWPGYIELVEGTSWAYCWLSNGPHTPFIPYNGGSGYYVSGYAFDDPEHEAIAVNGQQWFAYKMKRDSNEINFDLTGIEVGGNYPITLYFKDSSNRWWYWSSLSPGVKNFGTHASNIKEFHLSSASGKASDYWTIDNIKIRPR